MELLQLKYFLHLAKSQHVTKTANHFHISQPSLSSTMKKLEKELGVDLFIRAGRNIVLSDYGKAYLPYVEQVFLSLENGENVLSHLSEKQGTHLSLGLVSPYIWNDLISDFHNAYPYIEVNRYSLEGDDYVDALYNRTIDMYIGGLNSFIPSEKLDSRILYEDEIVMIVNKKNPLSEHDYVALSDCGNQRFINLRQNANLQKFLSEMYKDAHITDHTSIECDYTLRDQMVIENYGVSLTTFRSAKTITSDQIKILRLSDCSKKRLLGLIWLKKKIFSPAMEKFYDFACKFYE